MVCLLITSSSCERSCSCSSLSSLILSCTISSEELLCCFFSSASRSHHCFAIFSCKMPRRLFCSAPNASQSMRFSLSYSVLMICSSSRLKASLAFASSQRFSAL
ncbi:hypothetical protein Plhal710r2_c047g0151781 [Plasmopara halstedii]